LEEKLQKQYQINDWLKAHTNHWCPIVSSKAIKKQIVARITELGASPFEVCIRADVSWNSFNKYYLKAEEPFSRPSLRPEDLMRIGDLIGIKIKTTLILGDKDDIDVSKLLNEKFIPHGKRKKNKKLTG